MNFQFEHNDKSKGNKKWNMKRWKGPETCNELKSSTDIFWSEWVDQVEAFVLSRVDIFLVFRFKLSRFGFILSTPLLQVAD